MQNEDFMRRNSENEMGKMGVAGTHPLRYFVSIEGHMEKREGEEMNAANRSV